MGTVLLLTNAGLFVLEILLQVIVISTQDNLSTGLFTVLLVIIAVPVILVNIVSAVKVIRTRDSGGQSCMRASCIAFHSVQFGLIWRAIKLIRNFDRKEWNDFLQMRLFHSGFESIPFSILISYSMFVNNSSQVVSIISVIVSLISASLSLTTYRTSDELFTQGDSDRKTRIRRIVGIIFLTFSNILVLFSRCSSIVLFSTVQPPWIAVPLGLQFFVHFSVGLCGINDNSSPLFIFLCKVFYKSFVNIFEKVGKGYTGVKCSYVFYYSLLLIQNLVLVFYWMLTADYGERLKLIITVIVLVSFIMGIIIKFSSCGCIYNIESDILSEAFTNPELKEEFKKISESDMKVNNSSSFKNRNDEVDNMFKEIVVDSHTDSRTHLPSPITASRLKVNTSEKKKKKGSKQGSSSESSTAHKLPYDNHAFANSQGNLSYHSPSNHSSHNISRHSSRDNRVPSNERQANIQHIRQKSRDSNRYSNETSGSRLRDKHHHSDESHNRSHDRQAFDHHNNSYDNLSFSVEFNQGLGIDHNVSTKKKSKNKHRQNNLIISDTSIYANRNKPQKLQPIGRMKDSNADLASSRSKHSRNTNTLNGSVLNYHYNGFDDPYRERRAFQQKKSRNRRTHHSHKIHHRYGDSFMDYSLDSSELYPSMTSDSESMTSYEYSNRRQPYKNRKRPSRIRNYQHGDGYSTDVSNSDYLSFNDYSMEDSSSWTESSDSESAITWPPSQSSNLLKMYDISESVSSKDNVMHWLDRMTDGLESHDSSFTTLEDPEVNSETDISLSAMQNFEVTKSSQKKKFRKLIPKPKEVILKFRSLNYKNKQKHGHKLPYPLQQAQVKPKVNIDPDNGLQLNDQTRGNPDRDKRLPLPTMPLPIDSVQESIV